MKNGLLILLCMLVSGCTLIYDSRGHNVLDLDNPSYNGIAADKAGLKTGRYIEIRILNKGVDKK